MKASIIVPIYNGKSLLKNCLLSLNHQNIPKNFDFEVIVVDDGSNDGTEDMVRSLNPSYDLKYFYKERTIHSSRSAARNLGIKHADPNLFSWLFHNVYWLYVHSIFLGWKSHSVQTFKLIHA